MKDKLKLQMIDIYKDFYGVQVLKGVNFELRQGEVHALVGENGAGKSTLMKILNGVYTKSSGSILIDGVEKNTTNPRTARAIGIGMVHQEISLVGEMTVAQNIFIGSEITKAKVFLDKKEIEKQAKRILEELEISLDYNEKVKNLSIAMQMLVEICKAVFTKAQVLVLDEPTASLSPYEAESLFRLIDRLKKQGVSIIYISHRLDEIIRIADRVTILRDGEKIATKNIADTTKEDIVQMMVGRDISSLYVEHRFVGTGTALQVEHFSNKYLKDVSFDVKQGEIFGIFGLVGARRTELLQAIFGIDALAEGTLSVFGKEITSRSPKNAIKNGIGLIPEDRKAQGLIVSHSVTQNITLLVLKRIYKKLRHNKAVEEELTNTMISKLNIKTAGGKQQARFLSGGNQQKVVIAKWLSRELRILMIDEPTRGVDVGAKSEIYKIIQSMAEEGYTVIMVSSEIEEVMKLSSRIAVMCEGKLSKIIDLTKNASVDYEALQFEIMKNSIASGE